MKNSLLKFSLILGLFLAVSCGSARQKEKTNLTENVKTEQTTTANETSKEDSNIKITKEITVDDKNETVIEE